MLESIHEQTSGYEAGLNVLKKSDWRPKNEKVFIKHNIGATSKFVNTHPEFVRGIIHYLHDLGIKDITIGEGSVVTEYESTSLHRVR